ncbi:MAG: hypothetical protein KC502_19285 [Myxococcales bacterium]|nr:hypothetical protein [Myxococcales bacterium]
MALSTRAFVLALTLGLAVPFAGCSSDDEGKATETGADKDAASISADGELADGESADSTAAEDAGTSAEDVATAQDAGTTTTADAGGSTSTDAGGSAADTKADKCGNGVCDAPDESLLTCAVDCAGGANCGDGKCEGAQENGFTCKKDCEVTAGKAVGCIMGGCLPKVVVCLADSDCGKALGCLQGCGSDMGCLTKCGSSMSPKTQQILGEVVLCGAQKGCFGIGGDGGDCGNGKCEGPTENPITCVKDCPAPVCGDSKCAPPLESYIICPKDCTKPVCGDGTCTPVFESILTCAKDCKPKTCGNKTCDKPAETSLNCFEDCKPGNAQANCLATKCIKEGLACGGDLKCLQANLCTGNCSDQACFDKCGDKLPAGSAKLFKAIKDCGASNACFK